MTMETLEQSTQMAAMQEMLAAQAQMIEELRAKVEAGGDGSLDLALREFSKDRVQPTTYTTTPCEHRDTDGRRCGRLSAEHVSEDVGVPAKVQGHTFRLTPFVPVDKPKPRAFYAKEEPVVKVEAPAEGVEDAYLTVAQAAKALGMKHAEVKGLVADGQLKADKVGSVILIRKVAVERVLALAAVAAGDGGEIDG